MDALLLPALSGALFALVACGILASRKQRPSFWLPQYIAVAVGLAFLWLAFGPSLFTSEFWTANPVYDPAIAGVLLLFGFFSLASLVPALIVVLIYRLRFRSVSGREQTSAVLRAPGDDTECRP